MSTDLTNTFVNAMLGWLKGLANWVLRLFNLAGSAGTSPLLWLSNNWLKLLILFLLIGIVLDVVVWLVRWRPYWVWFRKERVIVNDEKFFAGGRIDRRSFDENDELDDADWQERDFVVASEASRDGRHSSRRASSTRPANQRRRSSGTIVRRAGDDLPDDDLSFGDEDALFTVDGAQPGVTDSYEDEVFNVSSLPGADDYEDSEPLDGLFDDGED